MKVEVKDVILPLILSFLGNVFILALWQGISPLQYERRPVKYAQDEYGRSTASKGTCTNSGNRLIIQYKWFIVALGVFNGAALVLANYQAYRARYIRTELSESRYIGLSMAIMLQGFLMAFPAFVTDTSSTTASYAIIAALISLVSGSVLYLIFIPKILAWHANAKNDMTDRCSSSYGLRIERHHLNNRLEDSPPGDQQVGVRAISQCSDVVALDVNQDEEEEEQQQQRAEHEPSVLDDDNNNVIAVVVEPEPVETPPPGQDPLAVEKEEGEVVE